MKVESGNGVEDYKLNRSLNNKSLRGKMSTKFRKYS